MRQARTADWLLFEDAVERILEAVPALSHERVPLVEAGGRVLAEPAISPLSQPPWDNSGMDGYAVHAADVSGATQASPVQLRIAGEVLAGGFPDRPVSRGEAVRIMTGAPLPGGADTVIRVEHTRTSGDTVEIFNAMDTGKNVRPLGEDIRAGETVLPAGIVLLAGSVGVLAAIGVAEPLVARRPVCAILSTGNELTDVSGVEEAIAGRRIINSNSYALAAGVHATGGEARLLGIARDDAADLRARLAGAMDADVLITTAGASVGDHDLVKDAMQQVGMEVLFWRVQMRPGSPFSFGLIRRAGLPPIPVFGLPGNPVSAVVTFELLVRPALRRMQGRLAVYPQTLRVRLADAVESKPGMTHFLRATLDRGGPVPVATLTGPQGSGILTSVARADALVVVPLDIEGIGEGEEAVAVLLDGGDRGQVGLG